jgi:ferredoxin-NAD(P)+ reductase (naphthalene dioxygenase ferredoxin-specific)
MKTGRESRITQPDDEGYVLACMSILTGDCVVEVPRTDEVVTHPARIIKATVTAINTLNHDIRCHRLTPAKRWNFRPGSTRPAVYARPYPPLFDCQCAGDRELKFHVCLVPCGRVTGYFEDQLKVGDQVRVSGPLGAAYLRAKHTGPFSCVGGGSGLLTPCRAKYFYL